MTPLKETYNQEYKTKLCNEGIDSTNLNPKSYATIDSLNENAQEIDFLTLVSRAEAAACAAHAAELAADQHRRTSENIKRIFEQTAQQFADLATKSARLQLRMVQ